MADEIKEISIDLIDYDETNPRIRHVFDEQATDEEIARELRANSNEKLRKSIRKTGGIVNPIKIKPSSGGRYKVFEGNTRLSIYKYFNSQGEDGWSTIKAIVFEEIPDKSVDVMRLQDHLVGTQPWGAYAKARYLAHLVDDMEPEEIAAYCGESVNSILTSIETYKLMVGPYQDAVDNGDIDDGPDPDPFFRANRFTAIEEYVKRDDVQKALFDNDYGVKDFAIWVAKGLFSLNQDVRELPKILDNEIARKVFLKEGSESAKQYLGTPALAKQLSQASILSLCAALHEALKSPGHIERKSLIGDHSKRLKIFEAIKDLEEYYDELNILAEHGKSEGEV